MTTPPEPSNDELTDTIIGVAIDLHRRLGRHQRERVYRRGMVVGLEQEDLQVIAEYEFDIRVYGEPLGHGAADLLVEDSVVLELKVVQSTTEDHFRQLGRNVEGCDASRGLLLNFGTSTLGIRRYISSASADEG